MSVRFEHVEPGKYVEVRVSGKLTENDYELFVPQFESLVEQSGKLRLLLILDDFHGWTFRGLWEDLKFDVKHFGDIDRLAIVGETKWQSAMTTFCRPFTSAIVRYFEMFELDDAREWLMKEVPPSKSEWSSKPETTQV